MADSSDDELNYYIKFPSVGPESSQEATGEKKFLREVEKFPVVLLFGWAGCKDKYLAKYSEIYDERGCITVRCTPPVVATFVRHDKLKKECENLLDLLHDMSLAEHRMLIHVFSNGGAFFYQKFMSLMRMRTKKLKVKGVIFDSAPGEKRLYSIYRALAAIIGGSAWYAIPLALIFAMLLYISYMIWAYVKGIIDMRKPQTDPLTLVDEPCTWPQLFIYSKDDELVRAKDVDKFATAREKKGIKVTRLCLENSPHVQHLLTNRDLYIGTVANFLEECMKEEEPSE